MWMHEVRSRHVVCGCGSTRVDVAVVVLTVDCWREWVQRWKKKKTYMGWRWSLMWVDVVSWSCWMWMTRKKKEKKKKTYSWRGAGPWRGWHWTRMVVGCGWWLNADGGWMQMVGGRGWWLDMDGGWMWMATGWMWMVVGRGWVERKIKKVKRLTLGRASAGLWHGWMHGGCG